MTSTSRALLPAAAPRQESGRFPVTLLAALLLLFGACGLDLGGGGREEVVTSRFPDGRLRSERVYRFRKGERRLVSQTLYSPFGGVDRYEDRVKGILRVMTRHENGNPHLKKEYLNGEPHGIWLEWDAMGWRRRRMVYRKGLLHGRWTEWDAQGKVVAEKVYERGRLKD